MKKLILLLVVEILFISGLLKGDLFPTFVPDPPKAANGNTTGLATIFAIHGQAADYGKMIFWSFLAGFSERFATDIISRFGSDASA